jgi:uncharacterized membrane protein
MAIEKISSLIDKKIKHLVWVLIANGIFLLILGVLIVWTDFMLKLVMGLVVIMIAYVFLYGAYKAWTLKKILDKYIKF